MLVIFMLVMCMSQNKKQDEIQNRKQNEQQAMEHIERLEQENREKNQKAFTVVIDPGHGGEDPGKIGINQAQEKDLNLIIAQKVQKILEEKEYIVMMTRTTDAGMNPNKELSQIDDLDARVKLMNEIAPKIAVSIHQNSYIDENIKGAQVFYYKDSKEGEWAAQIMQESLRKLDPENHREMKDNDSYYLLRRTQTPIIIVECGFLSNASEADKLVDDEYQNQLAEAIARGIEMYFTQDK